MKTKLFTKIKLYSPNHHKPNSSSEQLPSRISHSRSHPNNDASNPFSYSGNMSSATGQPLVGVEDYEKEAHRRLPRVALGYYRSGALDEETLRENKEAMKWYEQEKQGAVWAGGWRV